MKLNLKATAHTDQSSTYKNDTRCRINYGIQRNRFIFDRTFPIDKFDQNGNRFHCFSSTIMLRL